MGRGHCVVYKVLSVCWTLYCIPSLTIFYGLSEHSSCTIYHADCSSSHRNCIVLMLPVLLANRRPEVRGIWWGKGPLLPLDHFWKLSRNPWKWATFSFSFGLKKLEGFQLQGGSPPWPPDQGLCPWTPLGAPPPDPHYRLNSWIRPWTEWQPYLPHT